MDGLPPYGRLLGLELVEEADGLLTILPFHDGVVGRPDYLHGGAIAGLLEFSAFAALRRAIGDDAVTMKPVTVTIDYMRGATRGRGETRAASRIERLGQRIANVEAVAWQSDRDKPVAAARINFLLERP